ALPLAGGAASALRARAGCRRLGLRVIFVTAVLSASVKAILTQIIKEEPNLPTLLDQESREDLARRAIRAISTLKKPSFDASWVKLRGGEFFFAPSIPFLTGLNTKS